MTLTLFVAITASVILVALAITYINDEIRYEKRISELKREANAWKLEALGVSLEEMNLLVTYEQYLEFKRKYELY